MDKCLVPKTLPIGKKGFKQTEIFQASHALGIVITDYQGNILSANTEFYSFTGFSPRDLVGKNPCFPKTKRVDASFYRLLIKYLQENENWQGELWLPLKNREMVRKQVCVYSQRDDQGQISHFVAVIENNSVDAYIEQQLDYLTQYDPLTRLPNRKLFTARLENALSRTKDKVVGVLFIDLDRLKSINDTLGYTVGDLVIQSVARRIARCVDRGSTVARLGGDEFLVIMEHIAGEEEAVQVARKILRCISEVYIVGNEELFVSASIGISLFPSAGRDTETLVKNAETAMDWVKEQGRNRYKVYVPAMNEAAYERLKLGNDLRRALERNEFFLHYQPQVELKTGRIIGIEALLRWNHPVLGLVYPNQFIPLAEETNLIVPIGEWVLHHACAQNKAWQEAGYAPVPVAVNLSARQFQRRNLAEVVQGVLQSTGLEAQHLDLEITESITMHNPELSVDTLSNLRDRGVSISVDDFGTGYSSLTYLRKFPINKLKIDKSFIQDVSQEKDNQEIVKAVIAMAQSLKLKVIAEGVESEAQLKFLKEHDCYGVQGYLVSKPKPGSEIFGVLAQEVVLPVLP